MTQPVIESKPAFVINDFMGQAGDVDDASTDDVDFGDVVEDAADVAAAAAAADVASPVSIELDPVAPVVADAPADVVVTPPADEVVPKARATDENRIPKSRFDEVNNKLKDARIELEALRAQEAAKTTAAESTFDFKGKERAYMEAVVDGNFDEAQGIREEIRAAETVQFTAQATAVAERAGNKAVTETQVAIEFKATVGELEAAYPELNPNVEGYNEAAVEEIVELRDVYMQRGLTPSAALRKAVKLVATDYGIESTAEAAAAPVAAPVAVPTTKPVSPAVVKSKVAAANAQPPATNAGQGGASEGMPNIFDMGESEFDKLPEKELAAMRGDFG